MTARFRKRDGVYIWCKAALTCLHDDKGNPKRYIGTLNDVDSATRSVLALKYRAEFDLLTDLYNMHNLLLAGGTGRARLPRAPLQHRPHGHRPLQGHQRPVRP